MSKQKEAWEEIWNSPRSVYFTDRKLRPGWGQGGGGGCGDNSCKVQISTCFSDLIDHDLLKSKYKSPLNYVAEDIEFPVMVNEVRNRVPRPSQVKVKATDTIWDLAKGFGSRMF